MSYGSQLPSPCQVSDDSLFGGRALTEVSHELPGSREMRDCTTHGIQNPQSIGGLLAASRALPRRGRSAAPGRSQAPEEDGDRKRATWSDRVRETNLQSRHFRARLLGSPGGPGALAAWVKKELKTRGYRTNTGALLSHQAIQVFAMYSSTIQLSGQNRDKSKALVPPALKPNDTLLHTLTKTRVYAFLQTSRIVSTTGESRI